MKYQNTRHQDSVKTPLQLINLLRKKFFSVGPYFDPCPLNPKYNPKDNIDGLSIDWGNNCFCNPPYSQSAKWLKYAHEQWKKNNTKIVCLVKLDSIGTRTFQKFCKDVSIYILTNRVRFEGYKGIAMFYSILIVFGDKIENRGKFFSLPYDKWSAEK